MKIAFENVDNIKLYSILVFQTYTHTTDKNIQRVPIHIIWAINNTVGSSTT